MSENLAVATATPSFFFLVSETIILREYIKDLIFVVLDAWNTVATVVQKILKNNY